MRNEVRLSRAFGVNEAGLADVPCKVSGVTLSRIVNGDDSGCSHCFPHGIETFNSHEVNRQRNWKRQRRTRWRFQSR